MEEEKKVVEENKEVTEVAEDEFLDSPKEEAVKEEPKAEEPKEEEVKKEKNKKEENEEPASYEYSDPRLEDIEEARIAWFTSYKTKNRLKILIFVCLLMIMLVGWILPTTLIRNQGMLPLYIALGICAGALVILATVSTVIRRIQGRNINEYFRTYYHAVDDYVFDGLNIKNVEGDINDKITMEEFSNMSVYYPVSQVGSRNNITFTYNGMGCALADVAAEKDGGRALQTIFVGKYLRCDNKLEVKDPSGLVIYFGGNKKALPPEGLDKLAKLFETKTYSVYGGADDKKLLTKAMKDELGKFKMTDLLCDVTIVIKSGRTFIGLGYDDPLMVLPSQKPFNPEFVMEFKGEFKDFINFALLLNK